MGGAGYAAAKDTDHDGQAPHEESSSPAQARFALHTIIPE
jgi:hypothetical protein